MCNLQKCERSRQRKKDIVNVLSEVIKEDLLNCEAETIMIINLSMLSFGR